MISTNEAILKECHSIYTNPDNGLVDLAENLGLKILAPRKKINILLIGNHSAGKSSFVNWYVEKHVQKEGIAIETQGITFITNGKKRETLTGNATLHLYPHLQPLREMEGVMQYLTTEICDSIAKKFPLVTFIDTPGLVDGNMRYAFDVNEAIFWLGSISDCILVFFDPIGQALCKRTMTVVSQLGEENADRTHFLLSKADEAGDETDRQRVLMQITQEVCKYPSLNRTCFDIKTIYNPNRNKPTRCVNQIEETAKEIERTIQLTIQNTLNQLERDCGVMASRVDQMMREDQARRQKNFRAWGRSAVLFSLAFMFPIMWFISCMAADAARWKKVQMILGLELADILHFYGTLPLSVYELLPESYRFYANCCFATLILFFFVLAKLLGRTVPTYTRKEKKRLQEIKEFVHELSHTKKKQLYEEYLKQCVKEGDY
jgi:GTPase SAR1 family protein